MMDVLICMVLQSTLALIALSRSVRFNAADLVWVGQPPIGSNRETFVESFAVLGR